MNNTEKKAKAYRETVHVISQYVLQPEMIRMRDNENDEFVTHMESLFPEFSKTQPALFGIAIRGENLENMYLILEGLIERSRGNISHYDMEKQVGIGMMETIKKLNNLN